jgi:hypothetical protein
MLPAFGGSYRLSSGLTEPAAEFHDTTWSAIERAHAEVERSLSGFDHARFDGLGC